MSINRVPTIRRRTANKLANTNYVNEVADVVASMSPFGQDGENAVERGFFPNCVVVISGDAADGAYSGKIMGGTMTGNDATAFIYPAGMDETVDTIPCLIFSGTESGRPSHRLGSGQHFPGMVTGHTDDDPPIPIVLIRPDILSDKRVRLTKVGGTDGDDTTPRSYTYNVFDADGVQLNSAPVSPMMQRRNGSFVEAAIGIGREKNTSPNFEIAWCDEVPTTDTCEGTTLAEFFAY